MVKKEKKDRKSYLKRMVRSTGSQQYSKYGDYDPSDVHEGNATLGAYTFKDAPATAIASYGRAVKVGHGKSFFRFQGKLYRTTNTSGTTSEQVQV